MGQNLAMIGGTPFKDLPGDRATFMWYNECIEPGHNFDTEKNSGTGHFTQVVWKTTKQVGAARIKVGDQSFVVANYIPAGNWVSKYKKNVPRPKSGQLEEILTEEMRRCKEFMSQHGGSNAEGGKSANVRVETSTRTKTVNGKRTSTVTEKTYHGDKLVKVTVNGTEKPLEQFKISE